MDRKKFILTTSLAAFGLSTYGSVFKSKDGQFNGDCETTNDILGPFYRPNAPMRTDLVHEGLEGNKIQILGNVYSASCVDDSKSILENAMVEIWQCDTQGDYDNESVDFQLRARQMSDSEGNYTFNTILPGKYLNGALYRPAHIHFRVSADNHKELISQIYFKGDPHITEDPWASQPRAELRVLPLIPDDVNGNLIVKFDINLSQA